ncbi:MAG: hypothetical protein HYY44_06420 [Deltaproteobacteria bacterium]|nr:hypothetical protein [Deltaproteobacteria bacterium]
MRKGILGIFLASIVLSNFAFHLRLEAAGINTNVALPVPKGRFILRTQTRYTRMTSDPSGTGRRLHLLEIPNVLVFGATARMALFSILPVLYRDLNITTPRRTAGLGDLAFLMRYEIYKRDWVLRTLRIALFGGLEVPSGDSPFSSGSVDVPLGFVATFQSHRQEVDLDLSYKMNTEGSGVDHGDDFIYNVAYQLRVFPWYLPEEGVPNQLNTVLELNGRFTQRDEAAGLSLANTGGNILFLSPGLQYVMKRVILETSFQYPVAKDLNEAQLESTWAVNGGIRMQF